jgi:hypothetical protein
MSGAITPLLQYAFMAWCSVKIIAQGQLYLYLLRFKRLCFNCRGYITSKETEICMEGLDRRHFEVLTQPSPGETEEHHVNILVTCKPAEIRAQYLLNTSVELHRYTSLNFVAVE